VVFPFIDMFKATNHNLKFIRRRLGSPNPFGTAGAHGHQIKCILSSAVPFYVHNFIMGWFYGVPVVIFGDQCIITKFQL